MADTTIDTGELAYLRSCGDKLRGIEAILNKAKEKNAEQKSPEDKLKKIKKIIKG